MKPLSQELLFLTAAALGRIITTPTQDRPVNIFYVKVINSQSSQTSLIPSTGAAMHVSKHLL